jgi:hypothetical protein
LDILQGSRREEPLFMASEYNSNHYVPIWYQRRFLPAGQVEQELYYLDFVPRVAVDSRGVRHPLKSVRKLGFRRCFAQDDLYTVNLGGVESTDIEKVFFGQVDNDAVAAVDCWANYTHFGEYDPKYGEPGKPLKNLLLHMSTQKLGAAKEEWLYPEKLVSKSDWSTYGDGWLLMPDPRSVNIGGTVMWGSASGKTGALGEYGREPWDEDFEKESKAHAESRTLYRFQGEFAKKFGPYRRGRCIDVGRFDDEKDSETMHEYYLANAERYRK